MDKDFLYYGSGTEPSLQFFPQDGFLNGCFNDTVPSNIVIPGDSAWLRYDTDQNIQSDGWALTYSIGRFNNFDYQALHFSKS